MDQKPRILIVEDSSNLRHGYAGMLKQEGFDVYEAVDGDDALTKVEDVQPDVILLDLMMPKMNGLEFLQKYDTKKHRHTDVVVYSQSMSVEMVNKAMAFGVKKYMQKAFMTPHQMKSTIEELLSKRGYPT